MISIVTFHMLETQIVLNICDQHYLQKKTFQKIFLNPQNIISLYKQSFAFKSSVVPLTPLQSRQSRKVFPSPVQCYANYAVSRFPVHPKQCSVMQSGEVKHSLQQFSAAKHSALWSSTVLSRSLKSSPIHASTLQCISIRNTPKSIKDNFNNPVP